MVGDRSGAPVGIGVASVFTVLLVLTLSVFSALTLTSARADLALSRTNADTVSAYYAADAQAARLYAEFAAGTGEALEAEVPMTDTQALHIHLVREDGAVKVLSWQTVPLEPDADLGEDFLPVWDGEGP